MWLKRPLVVLALLGLSPGLLAAASDSGVEDHRQIEGPFFDGPEVTEVCLECHEEAAHDFMRNSHWTWSTPQQVAGHGLIDTGKRHAVNNFCYGIASNLSKCTECHAGYGWKNNAFDFSDPVNIDCLVCHDTTGEYRRIGGDGGVADPTVDLEKIAQQVGAPGRANCGQCHFYGGGAHAVKHGDLEGSLLQAGVELDVHMASDGENFACQRCHKTEAHQIPGTSMAASPGGSVTVSCASCHEAPQHENALLNLHTESVACQTCHIPRYAKGEPTKVFWDWSQAGGDMQVLLGEFGKPVYSPYKGRFVWDRDLVPSYAWSDGRAGVYRWGEPIDPAQEVKLNWPLGERSNSLARIRPFKLHRARQIYDAQYSYLINPHLVPGGGFVDHLDWDRAARVGMAARGLPYSGHYDFVDTVMYWRINHMVAPAEQALGCRDCHGRGATRMDWQALGYQGDPLYVRGQSRNPARGEQ